MEHNELRVAWIHPDRAGGEVHLPRLERLHLGRYPAGSEGKPDEPTQQFGQMSLDGLELRAVEE